MRTPLTTPIRPLESFLEKSAASPIGNVPDDVEKWPAHVLSELQRVFPFLGKYDVAVNIDKVDAEVGYGAGYAMIRNFSARNLPQADVVALRNYVRIPIIIQERKLLRPKSFELGGEFYALNKQRIGQAMSTTQIFDGAENPTKLNTSLFDEMFPAYHRRNGTGRIYDGKIASAQDMLDKAAEGREKIAAFLSSHSGGPWFGDKEWLEQFYSTPFFEEAQQLLVKDAQNDVEAAKRRAAMAEEGIARARLDVEGAELSAKLASYMHSAKGVPENETLAKLSSACGKADAWAGEFANSPFYEDALAYRAKTAQMALRDTIRDLQDPDSERYRTRSLGVKALEAKLAAWKYEQATGREFSPEKVAALPPALVRAGVGAGLGAAAGSLAAGKGERRKGALRGAMLGAGAGAATTLIPASVTQAASAAAAPHLQAARTAVEPLRAAVMPHVQRAQAAAAPPVDRARGAVVELGAQVAAAKAPRPSVQAPSPSTATTAAPATIPLAGATPAPRPAFTQPLPTVTAQPPSHAVPTVEMAGRTVRPAPPPLVMPEPSARRHLAEVPTVKAGEYRSEHIRKDVHALGGPTGTVTSEQLGRHWAQRQLATPAPEPGSTGARVLGNGLLGGLAGGAIGGTIGAIANKPGTGAVLGGLAGVGGLAALGESSHARDHAARTEEHSALTNIAQAAVADPAVARNIGRKAIATMHSGGLSGGDLYAARHGGEVGGKDTTNAAAVRVAGASRGWKNNLSMHRLAEENPELAHSILDRAKHLESAVSSLHEDARHPLHGILNLASSADYSKDPDAVLGKHTDMLNDKFEEARRASDMYHVRDHAVRAVTQMKERFEEERRRAREDEARERRRASGGF